MKVIKIVGKKYDKKEVEENAKIVKKWYVVQQVKKNDLKGKYHEIGNTDAIENEYRTLMSVLCDEKQKFYTDYIDENWQTSHPIMSDVSRFEKIRPKDGVEFCLYVTY